MVASVVASISEPRFAPYRAATANDVAALELYRWNLGATSAVGETVGVVEVALRNAIDYHLRMWYAAQLPSHGKTYNYDWVRNPAPPLFGLLNITTRSGRQESAYTSALARARKDADNRDSQHPRAGAFVNHDDTVAHLMFGTWVNLLPNPRHDPANNPSSTSRRTFGMQKVIWDNSLKYAFPYQHNSATVYVWADRIYQARNQGAHHEPFIHADLVSLHRAAARLLKAIDPNVEAWYTGISTLPDVIRVKPSIAAVSI